MEHIELELSLRDQLDFLGVESSREKDRRTARQRRITASEDASLPGIEVIHLEVEEIDSAPAPLL